MLLLSDRFAKMAKVSEKSPFQSLFWGLDGFYLEANYLPSWFSENINQAKIVAKNTVHFPANFCP